MSEIQDINYVYIDGLRVNYIKKGAGAPLLLIHGFMGSILIFDNLIKSLSKYNTVLAVDLLGFGYSDKHLNFNYSRKNMAEICRKFMLSQGFNNFIILGHSMGGEVALNMSYYYPQNIKKLILVNSTGYTQVFKLAKLINRIKILFKFIIKIAFRTYYLQNISFRLSFYNKKKFDKNLFNRLYSIMIRIPVKTLYQFSIQDDSGKIGEKVNLINTDSLIIWGENDKIIPLRYGKKFNEDLMNSTLIILPKCGHIPFVESYESFMIVLHNYLFNDYPL